MSNVKKAKAKKEKPAKSTIEKTKKVVDGVGNGFDAVKLGEDLVKFRYNSQISQLNFAKSVGISKTIVYDIEVGCNLSARILAKVLPAIGQSFERYIIKHKIVAG